MNYLLDEVWMIGLLERIVWSQNDLELSTSGIAQHPFHVLIYSRLAIIARIWPRQNPLPLCLPASLCFRHILRRPTLFQQKAYSLTSGMSSIPWCPRTWMPTCRGIKISHAVCMFRQRQRSLKHYRKQTLRHTNAFWQEILIRPAGKEMSVTQLEGMFPSPVLAWVAAADAVT